MPSAGEVRGQETTATGLPQISIHQSVSNSTCSRCPERSKGSSALALYVSVEVKDVSHDDQFGEVGNSPLRNEAKLPTSVHIYVKL